jgi:hypothetical protein
MPFVIDDAIGVATCTLLLGMLSQAKDHADPRIKKLKAQIETATSIRDVKALQAKIAKFQKENHTAERAFNFGNDVDDFIGHFVK